MDDIVRQAMAKWPHVPNCYGWLGLDARGNWYMRDDRAQAAGPFAGHAGGTAASKGSLLRHEKLVDFIQRNYDCDAQGQWFFQNGPQRVYVELEATPWVWRIHDDLRVMSHTGLVASPSTCLLDEAGHLYLACDIGFGRVHTQDMGLAAEAVERGLWIPLQTQAAALPAQYGYVVSPQALAASQRP